MKGEDKKRNVDKISLDSGLIATSFNTVYSDRNKTKLQSIIPAVKAVKTGKRIKEYKKVIFQIPRKWQISSAFEKKKGLSTTDITWKNRYWKILSETERTKNKNELTTQNNTQNKNKVNQRPGINRKTKEATNQPTLKQPLLCNE